MRDTEIRIGEYAARMTGVVMLALVCVGCDAQNPVPIPLATPTPAATMIHTLPPPPTGTPAAETPAASTETPAAATPTATPTETETATAAVSATETATEPPSGDHDHIEFGSSQPGGGAVAIASDSATSVPVSFSACLEGTVDQCSFALYSGVLGFEPVTDPIPEESLYPLGDGIPLSIELTALDAAVSLKIENDTLDQVGQSAVIGTTAPGFHEHGEWQLAVQGTPPAEASMSYKLTAPGFDDSAEHTVTLVPPAE